MIRDCSTITKYVKPVFTNFSVWDQLPLDCWYNLHTIAGLIARLPIKLMLTLWWQVLWSLTVMVISSNSEITNRNSDRVAERWWCILMDNSELHSQIEPTNVHNGGIKHPMYSSNKGMITIVLVLWGTCSSVFSNGVFDLSTNVLRVSLTVGADVKLQFRKGCFWL